MDVAQQTPRRLAELSAERPLPLARCLEIALSLARQARARHEDGRWHGDIRLQMIDVVERGAVRLREPTTARVFGGNHCELEICPPEFAGEAELRLPEDLRKATAILKQAGVASDVRRIDVYQIGVVLCQLLTGKAVRQYAESARLKSSVPPDARELLDRMLGFDSPDRVQTCNALCDLLETVLHRLTRPQTQVTVAPSNSLPSSDTAFGDDESSCKPAAKREATLGRVAHFRFEALIGRGGMGEVYRAYDEKLNRIVAVKVLRPDLGDDASFARRFQAEVDAIKQLPHPNLLPLYYTGIDQGRRFYAMRYIDGPSLASRLRTSPLTLEETIDIALQCLSALAVAHDDGLIHRDIKPANVLLENSSTRAYLVDFGLARRIDDQQGLTRTGVVVGSFQYISPEQARGDGQIDHRADLYSFGVMLYQMLSGRLPFSADSEVGWLFQHVNEAPPSLDTLVPELPPELSKLVDELLAKKPDDRPPHCRAVIERLQPLQQAAWRATQFSSELSMFLHDDESLTAMPTIELPTADDLGLWQRVCDRAATMFRRRTPEWIARWQSDEQQIDAACAQLSRRKRRLQALQAEGHQLLHDLRAHLKILATSSPTDEVRASLEHQMGEITEQVANVDLQMAQVNAALLKWSRLRDAHGAPGHRSEHKETRPQRRLLRHAAMVALLALVVVGIPGGWQVAQWIWTPSHSVGDPQPPPPPDTFADPEVTLLAGPVEVLAEQLADSPANVNLLQQRSLWFALRHRWGEARQDLETVVSNHPEDLETRIKLATICLMLDDQTAYRGHAEYLRKFLTAGMDLNTQLGIINTLCLDPQLVGAQELQVRLDLLDDASNSFNLVRARPGVAYRTHDWNACVARANTATGSQGPMNLGYAIPWMFRIMALHKLGQDHEAKRLLVEMQSFAARQTVESVTGGWFDQHRWSSRFEWLLYDGLRTQILYRQAAGLSYGRSESLDIPQVDFVRYADLFQPPVAPPTVAPPPSNPAVADPLQTQVAEQVLALGGKLQVQVVGSSSSLLVESAAALPSEPYEIIRIILTGCEGVTPSLMANIGQLTSLQDINLLSTGVDDAAVVPLAKLPRLRFLGCGNSRVTGDCLAEFEISPTMRGISFGGPFQGRNLIYFTKFPNLERAFLGWTGLTDDDLQHLLASNKMRQVILDHTKISGAGLVHLARWPNLDDLWICDLELNDSGLANLPPLPRLTNLRLHNTDISDASVAKLKQYTSLRLLTLNGTKITASGLAELRTALPMCTIEHD